MARRDQPRADRQCRTIRVSTIAVTARLTKPPMVLRVSKSDREPSPISSTLAGHSAGVQPLKAGFQNSIAATLKPMTCTYSKMTTPHSNRERSRPVGHARPRWTTAAV